MTEEPREQNSPELSDTSTSQEATKAETPQVVTPPPRVFNGHQPPFDNSKPWEPWWLLRLVFSPKKFFAENLPGAPDIAVNFIVMTVGVALVAQRMAETTSNAVISAKMTGAVGAKVPDTTWMAFWMSATIGGMFGGWLRYLIGGWWYRVRINWSGDWKANSEYARVVFIHSELVWAAPVLMGLVYETIAYATPTAAAGQSMVGLIVIPAMLYSYYCSFRGVIESFDVGEMKAAAWFLVLPAFITCSAFIIGVIYFVMNFATVAPK